MDKRDFFLAAMKADEFRRTAWVVSAFSLVKEDPEAWKKDPYPYRIVQLPTGHWFVDPENPENLIKIDGVKANEPAFRFHDHLELKSGEVENLKKNVTTTYGNVLVNYTSLIWPFGHKIEFLVGKISAPQIEDLIIKRLKDTPKEGEHRDEKFIYVDEYLKFCNSMFYLAGFTQLCVPAGTEKSMTVNPEIYKLRAKLLEENKDRLHDPAVIAKIDAELVKADKEWIKGDPAENFLLGGKAFNVVRRKLYLQMGAEMGLEEGTDVVNIPTSLSEGWDITKFPAMNNSLRAGSFNRGAQTMLGGESVKWLLRASSNMTVAKDDCGSKLGVELVVKEEDKNNWVGFSVVGTQAPIKITEENFGQYLGKTVLKRSPMYCKLDKTDYCAVCVGDRLAANPTALSSAISEYGSAFLSLFMAAAHGKALLLAHMDFRKAII
jgi:hypothetical protein